MERGRIGPFGVAELGERHISILCSHGVGVGPKGQSGVGVTETVRHPADVSPGLKRECRPRVPRCMQLERENALLLRPTSQGLALIALDIELGCKVYTRRASRSEGIHMARSPVRRDPPQPGRNPVSP